VTGGRQDPRLARFSLNQRSVPGWDVPGVVAACAAAGVPAVGLWREPVAEHGLAATAALVAGHGLRVSSLCRGGFLTAADEAGRRAALDDNRRAIEEAATLGAACLVLVVGGLPAGSRDLVGARERVRDLVAELAPQAGASGVRLAIEALHPMFAADRAVVSTLDQALRLAAEHPPAQVGVVVDAYHQWWEPDLVADWVPLGPDALLSRGVMGEGCIDLAGMTRAVTATGYAGDVEAEIFSARLWAAPPREAFDAVLRGYLEHVAPHAAPVGSRA